MRTSAGVAWPSLSTADGQVHGQIIELPVVGAEGVSLAPDQCTLLYYDLDVNDYNGGLKAYDACTQEALDDPVAPIPSDIGGSQYDVYSWAQPLSNDYTIRCVSQYLLYYVDTSGDVVTTFDLAIDDDGFDGCEWYGVSGSDIWVSYGDTLAKFTPGYSEPTDRVIVTTETATPGCWG